MVPPHWRSQTSDSIMNAPSTSTELVPPPPRRSPLLSRRQRRILRAVAEGLFSEPERPIPATRLDWLEVECDDFLAATTGMTRTIVWLALTVLQFSPPLSIWAPRLMTGCTIDQRQKCLERIESSPLVFVSLLVALIKAFLSSMYFEHPDALAETGFDGMCVSGERPDRPLDPAQARMLEERS